MKTIFSILVLSMLATPVLAMDLNFPLEELRVEESQPGNSDQTKKHKHHNYCKMINFTKDQKRAYKHVRGIFMKDTEELRANMKDVHKRYAHVLFNPHVDGRNADRLARRLNHMSARLRAERTDLFHTIVYDIATAKQRHPLLGCVRQMKHHMMMKKMKEMHKGHHKKKGDHQDGGGQKKKGGHHNGGHQGGGHHGGQK